jgi:hypothetical protein
VLALALALLVTTAVDGEPEPAGGHAGLAVGGGVVGGDAAAGVDVVLGVGTAPFSFFVRAPLVLRIVDRVPLVGGTAPSYCRVLRCEEFLRGDHLDATALARLVEEVRLFLPGDPVRARAGRLLVTLGEGAVVDRFTTAPSWDRRTSGAVFAFRTPWHRTAVDVVVADVLSPAELVAARLDVAPLSLGADDHALPLRLSFDTGVDAFAPTRPADRFGSLAEGTPTTTASTSVLAARLELGKDPLSWSPRLEAGMATGWSRNGGPDLLPAAGVGAGIDIDVHTVPWQARTRATVAWGQPGYRRAPFSTLYLVERRRALIGATVDDDGIPLGLVGVPAPGGLFVDARLEASLFDVVAPLARLHLGPSPGENVVELGLLVDEGPLRLSVSALRRGLRRPADVVGGDLAAYPVVGVLEAALRVSGPVSVGGRWMRLPRFRGDGLLRIDDDVWVFVSVDGLLAFR